jgi:hypothetical protein
MTRLYLPILLAMALGCASSTGSGKDASADTRGDAGSTSDAPTDAGPPCPDANVCGAACCGSGYMCTWPVSEPDNKTCSKLCECGTDSAVCPPHAGCCTPLVKTGGGLMETRVCLQDDFNGCCF